MPNKEHQSAGPQSLHNANQQIHAAVVVPTNPMVSEVHDPVKPVKKATVLETHGYALGKNIGQGSYATVKVI